MDRLFILRRARRMRSIRRRVRKRRNWSCVAAGTVRSTRTIERKDENKLRKTCARIEELIAEYEITEIVLGLPKNMRKAAQTAALGKPFLVDVGVFGKNRYFVYVAAFGAFTEVSYSTPQETKNILGHQAYMLEAIKRLTGLKSYRMRLTWEHLGEQRELEEEFILGMVTNTTSIGGFKGLVGMDVALDDGEFEVLLVRKPRTPLDIASIAAYLIQREGENECVFKFRTSKLTVQSEELVDWSLDGEFGGSQTEVVIENKPREIAIRVPEVTVRG